MVVVLISAIFSGGGAACLLMLLDLAQLCSLFALINIPIMPGSLISLFRGISVLTLSFIPSVLDSVPSSSSSEEEKNRQLTDNSKYVPYIFLLLTFLSFFRLS